MKTKIPYQIFMAVGLPSISLANLISLFIPIPHFVRGFFVGMGLVFVIFGFIGVVKQRRKPTV